MDAKLKLWWILVDEEDRVEIHGAQRSKLAVAASLYVMQSYIKFECKHDVAINIRRLERCDDVCA